MQHSNRTGAGGALHWTIAHEPRATGDRSALVRCVSAVADVPRSRSRLGGAAGRRRYRRGGRPSDAESGAAHTPLAAGHGRRSPVDVCAAELDARLGVGPLQSAVGTALSASCRMDGLGRSRRKFCAGGSGRRRHQPGVMARVLCDPELDYLFPRRRGAGRLRAARVLYQHPVHAEHSADDVQSAAGSAARRQYRSGAVPVGAARPQLVRLQPRFDFQLVGAWLPRGRSSAGCSGRFCGSRSIGLYWV